MFNIDIDINRVVELISLINITTFRKRESMIVYRLKELATDKGWNKSKVHYASGVSYPTVSRIWENDKVKQIDMNVLDMLCAALECRPCDLIDRVDNAAAN